MIVGERLDIVTVHGGQSFCVCMNKILFDWHVTVRIRYLSSGYESVSSLYNEANKVQGRTPISFPAIRNPERKDVNDDRYSSVYL